MRLALLVVATVVILYSGRGAATAAATPIHPTLLMTIASGASDVARVLNTDSSAENTKRILKLESSIDAEDEERVIAGLSKVSEKLKPMADKLKPVTKKLSPIAEKATDSTMAIAVRLKPIADKFLGKLKPIADTLMPILKPLGGKLNSNAVINRVTTKLKEFVEKVKNFKIGQATLRDRYRMAKFEYWFKQKKSPDDVKEMLKVGAGPIVNTKNQDLLTQYTAFYRWAQRDKEMKAKSS
ncbi:unnamed protein product [Phytophthora fragariaefolia]|uniref:Unnamed protein product n=1 Tax=Phytophthora fragariaefolia TaxID=1490495 RepID=A0A9W6XSK1_9STRA|nr:unnamed protein product [Phytophthora fragariaefolia]